MKTIVKQATGIELDKLLTLQWTCIMKQLQEEFSQFLSVPFPETQFKLDISNHFLRFMTLRVFVSCAVMVDQ